MLRLTRRNSRRLSALGQLKFARIATDLTANWVATLQLQQKRPHQQQKGHEARHRIARQADKVRIATRP